MEKLKFIPELDSFRFFAVLLVIFSHWVPNNIVNIVPNGFLGVTFFYVLSGYLISTNLLYFKQSIDSKEIGTGHALKSFYIRRSLRIFPLYFLIIFIIFLINDRIFLGHIAWYLTYTPNILIFKEHRWQGMLSHFWSLGVEEQFYLVWPLLIFLVNFRWLKVLFSGIIVLSILFKYITFRNDVNYIPLSYTLPINCFDAFGCGALLAYFSIVAKERLKDVSFYGAFLLFTLAGIVMFYSSRLAFLFEIVVSFASLCLIAQAIKGYSYIAHYILDLAPIKYLGKISYGLYGFHNFMPWLWRCMTGQETDYPVAHLNVFSNSWFNRPIVAISAQFILLITLASGSWFIIEKPISNLKNRVK
jgi:peptidoglycan/LPS O-acetylase OafA/YrhL